MSINVFDEKTVYMIVSGYMRITFIQYTTELILELIKNFFYENVYMIKDPDLQKLTFSDDLLQVKIDEDMKWKTIKISPIFENGKYECEIKFIKYNGAMLFGIIDPIKCNKLRNDTAFDYFEYAMYCNHEKYTNKTHKFERYMTDNVYSIHENDVFKCVVDLRKNDNKTIEFYRNGKSKGIAYENMDVKKCQFAIAMFYVNTCIRITKFEASF